MMRHKDVQHKQMHADLNILKAEALAASLAASAI